MSSDNEPRFDITQVSGLKAAEDFLEGPVGRLLFPGLYLAKKVFDYLNSESEVSPRKQAEVAEKIIDAARRNGVKRLKFKVEKSVGAKIKGNMAQEATVSASAGSDGKIELEIEF